jgi:hypothetical protein
MTNDDINSLVELLKQLQPGFYPYPIFEQFARLVVFAIVEFIPLRKNGDVIEVLLLARDENDALWPGMLHTPGTVVRPTDSDTSSDSQPWGPFQRLYSEELTGTKVGPLHFVGSVFHASKRGHEQAQLYWLEVLDDPAQGVFYPVNQLPDTIITSQIDFIVAAARHYEQFLAQY